MGDDDQLRLRLHAQITKFYALLITNFTWNVPKILQEFFHLPMTSRIIFMHASIEASSVGKMKMKMKKGKKKGGGDEETVVGSVKFTAKHLFVCNRAIVRREFNKPRVWSEKKVEKEKKLKITKSKKKFSNVFFSSPSKLFKSRIQIQV